MLVFYSLRYYSTFKVRKFESLFYKINTCLQKNTTCFGLWAEQIFPVNIQFFFSILGVVFAVLFLLFLEAPASCAKTFLK